MSMTVHIPILVHFDDDSDMPEAQALLRQVLPGTKVRHVGFYHDEEGRAPYVGLVYHGSLRDPECQELIAEAEKKTEWEEENG